MQCPRQAAGTGHFRTPGSDAIISYPAKSLVIQQAKRSWTQSNEGSLYLPGFMSLRGSYAGDAAQAAKDDKPKPYLLRSPGSV